MDPSDSRITAPAPRRTPRTVLAVVALLFVLLVLAGRWLSPNLTVAGDSTRRCDDAAGYCVDHVTRGELLFLAPYDELHVSTTANPDRYYTATNPFDPDADLTVAATADAVTITDGTLTLSWDRAVLARLGD